MDDVGKKVKKQDLTEGRPEERINPVDLPVPDVLPVLPLHGFVFFPGMGFPLQISHNASKMLIDKAVLEDRLVAIVTHKQSEQETENDVEAAHVYTVGVLGYIHKLVKAQNNVYHVLVSAVKKLKLVEFVQEKPFITARVSVVSMIEEDDQEVEALILNLQTQFKKMAEMILLPAELLMTIDSLNNPFYIAYLIASQLTLPREDEQELLEIDELKPLLHRTSRELNKRLETVEVSQEIQKNIKEDTESKQREFVLRQQLNAIRKELGDDQENLDLKELKQRFESAVLPKEAHKTAEKELDRLSRISPSSPEYTVSRTYLDWILDLPWEVTTKDSLDIERAQKILDHDHYGLQEIKKRIVEFLAVRKLKQDMHGPILCFVGPPGVGKTSLGQSIARCMDRKFVRISLGGVRDEAEIRGHRRTYIGALPGRIIQSLKKAGSNNPLFM